MSFKKRLRRQGGFTPSIVILGNKLDILIIYTCDMRTVRTCCTSRARQKRSTG